MTEQKKLFTGKETGLQQTNKDDNISSKAIKPTTDHNLLLDINNSFNLVSKETGNLIKDYTNLIKLLPYLNLAKEIIVSSIMSPKDMISVDINYIINNKELDPNIISTATAHIKEYFTNQFPLNEKIKNILEETLFDKGAYTTLVLPESIIDNFIAENTVSNESFNNVKKLFNTNKEKTLKSIGILGSGKKTNKSNFISRENYQDNGQATDIGQRITFINDKKEYDFIENLVVTDDFELLKIPQIISKISNEKIYNLFNNKFTKTKKYSTEKINSEDVYKRKIKSGFSKHILNIPNLSDVEKKSIGSPLIKKLPMESVIPVFKPGNETEHVGFFIILDGNGNPVDMKYESINYNDLGSSSIGKFLEQRAKNIFGGETSINNSSNNAHRQEINKIYASIIETDLINRLKNGIYDEEFSIAKDVEIYNLMLSRTLAGKFTQLLFVPKQFLSYIAYKYNEKGIGKSLLEDVLILCQLSLVIRLANILLGIKNSINTTKVTIKLDEKDPDPKKTIEELRHLVNGCDRINLFPNLSNVPDIVNELNKAGILFEFSGNSKIPDMQINKEYIQANFGKVDQDTSDNLKKDILAGLYLTTELVDQGFGGNFAYTDMANNTLFTKRMIGISSVLLPQISNFCKMILSYDYDFRDKLESLINENINNSNIENNKEVNNIDNIINTVINSLQIELPKPPSISLQRQMQDLEDYVNILNTALEYFLSDKIFPENSVGEISSKVETFKEIIKANYIREFMSKKGILPELFEINTLDKDKAIVSNFRDNYKDLIKNVLGESLLLQKDLEDNILKALKNIDNKLNDSSETKNETNNEESINENLNTSSEIDEETLSDENTPPLELDEDLTE